MTDHAARPVDGPGNAGATRDEILDDVDYRAHATFRYALRRFERSSEDNARAVGITPQQHMLLLAVRGHPSYPEVTITEIAEYLQVRHHSASLLVDRDVKKNLLLRRQGSIDRRRTLVSLSPEGDRVLEAITTSNRRELRALEGALSSMRASLARLRGAGESRTSLHDSF